MWRARAWSIKSVVRRPLTLPCGKTVLGSCSPHLNRGRKEYFMANKRPDYRVVTSRESGGKSYYSTIGSAWKVAKDGISIEFSALPVPETDSNGKVKTRCVLFPWKDEE